MNTTASTATSQPASGDPFEQVTALAKQLRMPYLRQAAAEIIPTARAQRWDPAETLRVLLTEETTGRATSATHNRRRRAGFPAGKTFDSWDAFARFTGTAPVPVWSGSSKDKVRLNRGGNRAFNCALHMIAVTQARGIGPGRAYVDKQLTRGKDRVAALRLLRRRLSDVVFTALRADQDSMINITPTPLIPLAA